MKFISTVLLSLSFGLSAFAVEDTTTTVLKCATALSDPGVLEAKLEIQNRHIVDRNGNVFDNTQVVVTDSFSGTLQLTHNIPYQVTKERLLKEIARATANEDVIVLASDLLREVPLAPPAIGLGQVGMFYLRASKENGTTLSGTMIYNDKTGSLFCDPLK